MSTLTALRIVVTRHITAAFGAFAIVMTGAFALMVDRAAPFEYLSTEISPRPVREGGVVTVTRNVIWNRQCDGEIYREIVKPSGQIALYDRAYRPFPSQLGRQSAVSSFDLPPFMLSPDVERGTAFYRGRVRFPRCGLSSRIWPIEVEFQQVAFEVVRR